MATKAGSSMTKSLFGATNKMKRPPGNQAVFSFQGRIVPTVVQKAIRTFWQKSYEGPKGSVKEFFYNKHLCFQRFNLSVNILRQNDKVCHYGSTRQVRYLFSMPCGVTLNSGE